MTSDFVEAEHEICSMTTTESAQLLLKLLPPKYTNESHIFAEKIGMLLSGLPLAISLAAGFIRQTLRTLEETLKILSRTRSLLLDWPSDSLKGNSKYPLTVLWEANLSELPESASLLLGVMAFLDPDNIYESILRQSDFSEFSGTGGQLQIESTNYLLSLRSLTNHSLVRRDATSLSVHRLVQDVTIRRMGIDARRKSFEVAVDLIWSIFPKQCEEGLLMCSLDKCQIYMSHVESLEERYHELSRELESYPLHLAEVAYFCAW